MAGADLETLDTGVVDRRRALDDGARGFARKSRAASTWLAYDRDWRMFADWCAEHGETAMPAAPDTLCRWLTDAATHYKVTTIGRKLAAISVAHQVASHPTPTGHPAVAVVRAGIRRDLGVAPDKVDALVRDDVAALVDPLDPDRPADTRDRALVLVGFAAALRRSELVALDLTDVAEDRDGLLVTVRRSKRDQEARGHTVGVPYGAKAATCPVRAWRDWVACLAAHGHPGGPAFRSVTRSGLIGAGRLSDRAVADMLARRAAAAGLPGRVAGHSLRSGFATTAARADVPDRQIMDQGRWRSRSSMDGYVRTGRIWKDNPAGKLGL